MKLLSNSESKSTLPPDKLLLSGILLSHQNMFLRHLVSSKSPSPVPEGAVICIRPAPPLGFTKPLSTQGADVDPLNVANENIPAHCKKPWEDLISYHLSSLQGPGSFCFCAVLGIQNEKERGGAGKCYFSVKHFNQIFQEEEKKMKLLI